MKMIQSSAVVSLRFCADLSFNTHMIYNVWVDFVITCDHAPGCALLPL